MTDSSTPADESLIIRPILFVDDSRQDFELAKSAFEMCDVDMPVVMARDGTEAIDYLNDPVSEVPAAVITDLKMPRVDGYELARWIKKNAALRHIPVIIFTSSRESRDVALGYGEDVNAYVVKPVRFKEYVEAVCSLSKFWQTRNKIPA